MTSTLALWQVYRAGGNRRKLCGDATCQGYFRRRVEVTPRVVRSAFQARSHRSFFAQADSIEAAGHGYRRRGPADNRSHSPHNVSSRTRSAFTQLLPSGHFDPSYASENPISNRYPLDDIASYLTLAAVVEPGRAWICMSSQILNIFQRYTLTEEVGDGGHAE